MTVLSHREETVPKYLKIHLRVDETHLFAILGLVKTVCKTEEALAFLSLVETESRGKIAGGLGRVHRKRGNVALAESSGFGMDSSVLNIVKINYTIP